MVFGLYLALQLRGASGRFIASMGGRCNLSDVYNAIAMERRALTISLCLELIISGLFYTCRHIPGLTNILSSEQIFLLYFARTHLTVTISLCFILGPKVSNFFFLVENTIVFYCLTINSTTALNNIPSVIRSCVVR